MFALVLLCQSSWLVAPMYLDEKPPESRALRAIVIASTAPKSGPPTDADCKRAEQVRAQVVAGVSFEDLVARFSSGPTRESAGMLGVFVPGMLAPPIDRFLFAAAVGDVSPVLEVSGSLEIVQRVEKDAGCAMIEIDGRRADAKQRADEVGSALRAGGDFAALAKQWSDDLPSAARGGQYKIFERGPNDQLIKKAVFELSIGQIAGPIESPVGLHFVKRLALDQIDPSLAEQNLIRARAIVVSWSRGHFSDPNLQRTQDEAQVLAKDLALRIQNGEDFGALAAYYDDEPEGRARGGDLGWLRRRSPQVPGLLDPLFLQPVGAVLGPIGSTAGWVLVQRTR